MGAKFIKNLNAAVEAIRVDRENKTRHTGRGKRLHHLGPGLRCHIESAHMTLLRSVCYTDSA